MVVFRVEGETGTSGVTQVTIPKAMLSGEMTVMIDGQVVSFESNDVIVVSDTSAETTFEINYAHSEHEMAVTGTQQHAMKSPAGEIPATGKSVVGHGTYFAKVRDGKIVEFSSHPDVAEMMMQLGLMPQS